MPLWNESTSILSLYTMFLAKARMRCETGSPNISIKTRSSGIINFQGSVSWRCPKDTWALRTRLHLPNLAPPPTPPPPRLTPHTMLKTTTFNFFWFSALYLVGRRNSNVFLKGKQRLFQTSAVKHINGVKLNKCPKDFCLTTVVLSKCVRLPLPFCSSLTPYRSFVSSPGKLTPKVLAL